MTRVFKYLSKLHLSTWEGREEITFWFQHNCINHESKVVSKEDGFTTGPCSRN